MPGESAGVLPDTWEVFITLKILWDVKFKYGNVGTEGQGGETFPPALNSSLALSRGSHPRLPAAPSHSTSCPP